TFVKGEKKWSYFSMVSTVGTPHCIAAEEFRVECMFPAECDGAQGKLGGGRRAGPNGGQQQNGSGNVPADAVRSLRG
ncbi:MAG TPA: hypothetical protein VEV37_09580, partial [Bryobacteraceae bacterium]|nr:hypothetical protein [Bryobacteraceae bacterium]